MYKERMAGNLKAWRARRGLTQQALAAKSGVGYASIARIETGEQDPTIGMLERLAEALGVDAVALLVGPEDEKESPKTGRRG
jgi:transcriptional regulator with XRE-family HTH domain